MNHSESIMDKIALKDPYLISGLMLFPIVSNNHSSIDSFANLELRTLEEGLKSRRINIEEYEESYESVRISNNYEDFRTFIIDGEGITGGKQNRIAASSLLIGPQKTKKIAVFCSEEGRWSGSNRFRTSNSIAYPSIRRVYTNSNAQSYSDDYSQSAVWAEISGTLRSLKISSPTQSMQEIYAKKEGDLERYKEYKPDKNQIGFMAATHRRILCIDIFYSHSLFGKFMVKLIMSYALETIRDTTLARGDYSVKKCEKFYNSLTNARLMGKKNKSPENYYITDSGVGKVLFFKKQLIHASFFPKAKAS